MTEAAAVSAGSTAADNVAADNVADGAADDAAVNHPGSWAMLPWGVARMAGFGIARLQGLADPQTVLAASRAAQHQDEQAAAFLDTYLRGETRAAGALVAAFKDDPLLRDAVLQSNEAVYPRIMKWLAGPRDVTAMRSKDRQYVDTLAAYLQRVCAKNDSISHFGPSCPIAFFVDEPGVHVQTGPRRRTARLARWVGEELVQSLRADPALDAYWPVRASPDLFLRPDPGPQDAPEPSADPADSGEAGSGTARLVWMAPGEGRSACLSHTEDVAWDRLDAAIWQHVSTASPVVGALTSDQGLLALCSSGGEGVRSRLRELEAAGIVRIGPALTYGEVDVVHLLVHALPHVAAGEDWRRKLRHLDEGLRAFADGPLAERETRLDTVRREVRLLAPEAEGSGRSGFYSDRSVVYEDCVGPVALVDFGSEVSALIRSDLEVICEMFMRRPMARYAQERDLATRWFADRFGSQQIDCAAFVEAFAQDTDQLRERYGQSDDALAGADSELGRMVRRAAGPQRPAEVRLAREDLQAALASIPPPQPAVCNPDLMIAAESPEQLAGGRFQVIVGDLHADEENLTHGMFAPHLRQALPGLSAEVGRLYQGLLRPGEVLMDVTLRHRNKTFARWPLECPDIEVGDTSPHHWAVPLSQLRVSLREGVLCLHHGQNGPAIRLLTLPFAWSGVTRDPFAAFGFPTRDGAPMIPWLQDDYLPRVVTGRVVLQRRRWRLEPGRVVAKNRWNAFAAVQALRGELDWPRHLYYKSSGEPKPMYCDLDSPLLVRQFVRVAKKASDPLTIEEMFPAPETLWLPTPDGPVTSELRCAMFRAYREVRADREPGDLRPGADPPREVAALPGRGQIVPAAQHRARRGP